VTHVTDHHGRLADRNGLPLGYRGGVTAASLRQQAEAEILDRAAALLARRGFEKTSVQDVATAVGLSKAGLLHHFPSKDALHAAVRAHVRRLVAEVLAAVADAPFGPVRDRLALEVILDVAGRHPGTVALLLSEASEPVGEDGAVDSAGRAILGAFGVEVGPDGTPAPGTDDERVVRVVGALGALTVLTLAAHRARPVSWRPHVLATCLDALGHRTAASR
jgi:AcrR family transcriptional regulator